MRNGIRNASVSEPKQTGDLRSVKKDFRIGICQRFPGNQGSLADYP